MLRYYSYYNVGGYKDMFLGDSSMDANETFYLPLLPVWEKKVANGDVSLQKRIDALKKCPQIRILTKDNNFGLPKFASTFFSHGGYKILLTEDNEGHIVFAIRDIQGKEKDEMGRSIPFLMVVTGDSEADRHMLENLTAYATNHLELFSNRIAALFSFDHEKNGVAFHLAEFTKLIEGTSTNESPMVQTLKKDIMIKSAPGVTALMVVPSGITPQMAATQVGLPLGKMNAVMADDIYIADTQDKKESLYKKRSQIKTAKIVGWSCAGIIAAAAGILIAHLLSD